MRIGAVQMEPRWRNVEASVARHLQMARWAISGGVDFVLFPELSLTGYLPKSAREWAIDLADSRLEPFQELVDRCHRDLGRSISLGVGAPLRVERGVEIVTVLFSPAAARSVSGKRFIHSDEEPFFVPSDSDLGLVGQPAQVALAICYELSIANHAKAASARGARAYAVSAAKTMGQMLPAAERLGAIAREHAMFTLVANAVGAVDGGDPMGGSSSAWGPDGAQLGELKSEGEGLLVLDTVSASTTAINL